MTFSLLFVCTGNVCRSPSAELLARHWANDANLAVTSAGVQALVGAGIDAPTADALRAWGVDPSAHRARQFLPVMAARADLVLVAELRHRDAVMTQVPRTLRRTFTLREFARLAPGVAGGPPTEVVARAAAARALHAPVDPADDEVPDPFRGDATRAVEVAELIAASVRTALRALGLARRPVPPARRRPSPGGPHAATTVDAWRVPTTPRPRPGS